MSTKRLNITIWGDAQEPPIQLSIAIPQELADRIQQTKVKATTITITELVSVPSPGMPELDKFKGG